MDYNEYFGRYEDILLAELGLSRARFRHLGNRGDALEAAFRSFLGDHMGREFEVGHGEIIDSLGRHAGVSERDGQVDCILVDPRHPRFAVIDTPATYMIEGVLLAGEIKAQLDAKKLFEVLEKSRHFKELTARSGAREVIFANGSDVRRFYDKRPFFLFCYESQISEERIHQVVLEYCQGVSVDLEGMLDAIFVLKQPSLINLGDGKGQIKMSKNGTNLTGWALASDRTLFELIRWATTVYPRFVGLGNYTSSYFWGK